MGVRLIEVRYGATRYRVIGRTFWMRGAMRFKQESRPGRSDAGKKGGRMRNKGLRGLTLWEKFCRLVSIDGDGCFLFSSVGWHGYGRICHGKSGSGSGILYAHRVSWELFHGPIPAGLSVLHRCDTPACVRPDHLFLGTQAENVADARSKGRDRHLSGFDHPMAKLTAEDIAGVREARKNKSATVKELSARYGVHQCTIYGIAVP